MPRAHQTLGSFIFLSRWLQAPLYFGLIVAQGVYVYHFVVELIHLLSSASGIKETEIMLTVLGLIDVVMIANLLIMVIVGGYETFVSRLNLQGHPDQPEWLSHVNAGVLKVKLATALIGISSIHLLENVHRSRTAIEQGDHVANHDPSDLRHLRFHAGVDRPDCDEQGRSCRESARHFLSEAQPRPSRRRRDAPLDTPRKLSLTPRFSEVTLVGVKRNRFSGLGSSQGNQKPLKRFQS